MRAFSSIITFGRFSRALAWSAAGLMFLAVATGVTLLAIDPGLVQAQAPDCTAMELDQDGDYTPGSSVDLTFKFTPDGCSPGELNQEFIIFLHEDIGFPSGFDEDDVVILAGGRFVPDWVSDAVGRGEPHEIELPGCQSWRRGSGDPGVCDEAAYPVVIELRNFKLPEQPDTDDDPYEVSIEWDGGQTLTDNIRVDATLEIDDDNEVGYGETVEIEGLGFTDGLSVDLYARDAANPEGCGNAGGSGWTSIGMASVGSDHRFESDVEIATNYFRNAGAYEVCAVDGAGVRSVEALRIIITGGLEVVGNSEVAPGDEVTLKFIGGGSSDVSAVRVAGREATSTRAGDNLIVTLPTNAHGTVAITVYLRNGNTLSAKVTIGDAELTVHGVPSRGLGLGAQFLVRSNNLPGTQVCQVSLGGIPLAFLDDDQDGIRSSGDCPEIERGGRFFAPVALAQLRRQHQQRPHRQAPGIGRG